MPPSSLSRDPTLHGRVLARVHEICGDIGSGTTSTMSKSLGFIIRVGVGASEHTLVSSEDVHRKLDLLLHPRVPPLVRVLPHLESLSLFRAEEGLDEIDVRKGLGLDVTEPQPKPPNSTDIVMMPVVPEATNTQPKQAPTATVKPTNIPNQLMQSAPQTQATGPTLTAPLPSPAQLPSSSSTQASTSAVTATAQPASVIAPMDEEEEDEEMPTIDMNSDSD